MNYTTEWKNDCFLVRVDLDNTKDEFTCLFMSDEHYDSTKCDRRLLKKHHEQAKERNAAIFKFGDTFDMMGGKYDPRSTKKEVRTEYGQGQAYFNDVIKDAAKFYEPYKDNIALIATGNHELSIKTRQEVDVLGMLCESLGVEIGKYNGFIRFQFNIGQGRRVSKNLYYTHGSGGNSPVTRGAIQTARRQDFVHADMFVSGHLHSEFEIPRPVVRLSNDGKIVKEDQIHWQLGTYKDDSMTGGWADMKGFAPPSLGGRWVTFKPRNENGTTFIDITSERAGR